MTHFPFPFSIRNVQKQSEREKSAVLLTLLFVICHFQSFSCSNNLKKRNEMPTLSWDGVPRHIIFYFFSDICFCC